MEVQVYLAGKVLENNMEALRDFNTSSGYANERQVAESVATIVLNICQLLDVNPHGSASR